MPTYTYQCPDCGDTFDEVRSMKEEHLDCCVCALCGGAAKRLYLPPQVVQDTYSRPLPVTTLRPVHCGPNGVDVVNSRSELRNLMKAHDKKYGTNLEHAR